MISFLFGLAISTLDETTAGHMKIFTIDSSYLNLALNVNGQTTYTTKIFLDDKLETTIDLQCAINETDITYELPFNVSQWKGKKLSVLVIGLPNNSTFMKRLIQTNNYNIQYDEQYRPGYHFTAKYGWINDPNGMFYFNGTYHMHYQLNPYGTKWGNLAWGHAISKDLLTWEYLPPSLLRDDLGMIFSGSSIVDYNNASGLGYNAILSFYTSSDSYQQQSMAYSLDGGYTWTKSNKNPIIPNMYDGIPDFRDPKVIEYSPGNFIMILAVGQHVEFWGSSNLVDWKKLSEFGEDYGSHDGVWECPDLLYFKKQNKWVLLLNINPGGYAGGSACQYFVGTFNGTHFTCEQPKEDVRWFDYGKDSYAIVTFSGDKNDRIIGIAWMNNWQYADRTPTSIFRSAYNLPRVFDLVDIDGILTLSTKPIEEVKTLRETEINKKNIELKNSEEYKLPETINVRSEIIVSLEAKSEVKLQLRNNENQYVDLYLDPSLGRFTMNRTYSTETFATEFDALTYCSVTPSSNYSFTLFLDNASIELFSDDGICTMTNIVYPDSPFNQLILVSDDATVNDLTIYELKRTMFNVDAVFPSPDPIKPDSNEKGKLTGGEIAGICIAVIIVIIVVVGVVIYCKFFKKDKQKNDYEQDLN